MEAKIRKILFRSTGGLGKQIMATAVVCALREQNPSATIHVQTSYPEAFANLPACDKFFGFQHPYFYEEHKDFEILECEPYTHLGYRNGECHLINAWCSMLGILPPAQVSGKLILDMHERAWAKKMVGNPPDGKKVVAFQWRGGTSYYDPQVAMDPTRVMHYRDLEEPRAQAIVDALNASGFLVVQVSLPSEPQLKGAIPVSQNGQVINPRFIFALLEQADGLIAIDSFSAHAWAALGKKDGLVLWGGTNPKNLGYPENDSYSRDGSCKSLYCNRPNTFLGDLQGSNRLWTCPYSAACMKFDPDLVVAKFKDTKG